MPAYLVVEVNITNPDEYGRYRRAAKQAEADSPGFRLLTRGGWGGDDPTVGLEGDWNPELLVIAEFPSREAAEEFYYSDSYQEALKIRERSSVSRAVSDLTGDRPVTSASLRFAQALGSAVEEGAN